MVAIEKERILHVSSIGHNFSIYWIFFENYLECNLQHFFSPDLKMISGKMDQVQWKLQRYQNYLTNDSVQYALWDLSYVKPMDLQIKKFAITTPSNPRMISLYVYVYTLQVSFLLMQKYTNLIIRCLKKVIEPTSFTHAEYVYDVMKAKKCTKKGLHLIIGK